MTRARRAVLASALALGSLTLMPGAPSYAVDQDCSTIRADLEEPLTTDRTGSPVQLLQVQEAQQVAQRIAGRGPGSGVTVAVVDSGVAESALMTVTRPAGPAGAPREILDYQGTAMAGLIAARGEPERPIGVAPDATILDVRVYDRRSPDAGSGEVGPSAEGLLAGLGYVASLPKGNVGVVAVALAVERSKELDRVLRALAAQDVVVVAATGDRPDEETDALYAQLGYDGEDPPHGEDARGVVWPAGNPGVVAVNASATVLVEEDVQTGDAAADVLRNSGTDVAAPTADAVSVAVDGVSTCLLPDVSTAWATAEVAGVVALLRSSYPRDTAAQVVARLEHSAAGSPRRANPLTGHGVVQPVEALTRALRPDERGAVRHTQVTEAGDERAEAPRAQADVLAGTKRNAVWWGLLAGGALVVAVLVRPVLARRRR